MCVKLDQLHIHDELDHSTMPLIVHKTCPHYSEVAWRHDRATCRATYLFNRSCHKQLQHKEASKDNEDNKEQCQSGIGSVSWLLVYANCSNALVHGVDPELRGAD